MRGGHIDDVALQTDDMEDRDDEDEARERPFNAHRFADGAAANEVIAEAINLLTNCERHLRLRRNKRRPADQKTFEATVEAILCDLMHYRLCDGELGVFVTRSHQVLGTRSRYRPPAYNKQFRHVLDLMERPEMGYIVQDVAAPVHGNRRSTVIRPGPSLIERMDGTDIALDDLGKSPHGETIVLKSTKDPTDYWDVSELREYDDTDETERMRSELAEINHWLAGADIRFSHTGVPYPHTVVDIRERQLRRVFTRERFDSGGRLFGGFWQNLRKQERRVGISIGGERAVELDYGQAGPRILYGMAGHEPPSNDLYAMPGYYQQRDGIKKVMSAMIFASDRLDRFPKDTKKLFRRSDKISEVQDEIERRHPLIADHFYRGLGHHTQFIESRIIIDVVLSAKAQGIFALPIHDAVMIPASSAPAVEKIMFDAFHRHSGVRGVVTQPAQDMAMWEGGL